MKKPKSKLNAKSAIKLVRVKTGTVEDFFYNVKNVMRTADKDEPIRRRAATLTFVDPTDLKSLQYAQSFLKKAGISS